MAKVIGDNFSEDVKINRMKLDEECELQPIMYQFYGEMYADAKAKKDAAKDKLDLVLAQREMYYRMNPPMEVKATEAVYSAMITQDTDVQNAKEELRKTSEALYHLDVAITSMEHRKSELDNLVKLYLNQYYANGNNSAEIDARKNLRSKREEQ
jgi:hypothetical protein